jgi:hypothetical protein
MRFNTREKRVIAIGCAVFVFILIYPQVKKIQAMHKQSIEDIQISSRLLEDTILERRIIQSERTGHQALQKQLQSRMRGFDLYSFVQATLKKEKLQERSTIQNVGKTRANAGLEGVEVQLSGVSMKELTTFLQTIRASNNLIALNRLVSLRPMPSGKGLYCMMHLHSPKS